MKLRILLAAVLTCSAVGILLLSMTRHFPHRDIGTSKHVLTKWTGLTSTADRLELLESDRDLLFWELFKEVRIFCFIATAPHLEVRAQAVKNTWAQRCNKYIFISSEEMGNLPVLKVPVKENRRSLWNKTVAALRYCYENELNKFDFFLKADDDTYVIMENLRAFLLDVPPSKPIVFGRKFKFKNRPDMVYMSGGAGYVISRGALRRIFEAPGPPLEQRCPSIAGEDVSFGVCATKAGVEIGDSRDRHGRQRFHCLDPAHSAAELHLAPWLATFDFYPTRTGRDCCSEFGISYHYVEPTSMKIMDATFYRLRSMAFLRDVETANKLVYRKIVQENLRRKL